MHIQLQKTLFVCLIGAWVAFFSGCQKEEIGLESGANLTPKAISSKDIFLSDAEGTARISMHVSGYDAEMVAAYSSENFVVIPVHRGETSEEALNAYYPNEALAPFEKDGDLDPLGPEESDAPGISFEIVDQQLGQDIIGFIVTFIHPESAVSRGWNYTYHYSQPNLHATAGISRRSLFNRVYFGLKYKIVSSAPWYDNVQTWRKLRYGRLYSVTLPFVYQYRFSVKYRRTSHYSIYFAN